MVSSVRNGEQLLLTTKSADIVMTLNDVIRVYPVNWIDLDFGRNAAERWDGESDPV